MLGWWQRSPRQCRPRPRGRPEPGHGCGAGSSSCWPSSTAPGAVPLPPSTTFYRLVNAMTVGRHTFGEATTRRTQNNRSERPFTRSFAVRPGVIVQTDTSPLDVMALLDDGVPGRVELTTVLDVATRTICAAVLRPTATKAVDAALLLARTLVPEPMRAGCGDALRMSRSRIPHQRLLDLDARLQHAAARPVIVPGDDRHRPGHGVHLRHVRECLPPAVYGGSIGLSHP